MKKLYALTALSALLATTPATASGTVSNQTPSTCGPSVNNGYRIGDPAEPTDIDSTTIEECIEGYWDIDD